MLAFAPAEAREDFARLVGNRFELEPQTDGDLGQRMAAFFTGALASGAERVVLVGTDSPTLPVEYIEKAFEECDILVTSGGASVGEMDFIKEAFEASGGTMEFWKVAIKPGRPFVFGRAA